MIKKQGLVFILCLMTINLFAQVANTPSDYLVCDNLSNNEGISLITKGVISIVISVDVINSE